MNFAQALEQLVHGNLVTRGDSGDFIFMQIPSVVHSSVVPKMTSLPEVVKKEFECRFTINPDMKGIQYKDQFAKVTPGNVITGWAPSPEDLLAKDWKMYSTQRRYIITVKTIWDDTTAIFKTISANFVEVKYLAQKLALENIEDLLGELKYKIADAEELDADDFTSNELNNLILNDVDLLKYCKFNINEFTGSSEEWKNLSIPNVEWQNI